MTATAMKQAAQDNLMFAMQTAFVRLSDDIDMTPAEREKMRKVMDEQMARVEKLFGYEPHSFTRGC